MAVPPLTCHRREDLLHFQGTTIIVNFLTQLMNYGIYIATFFVFLLIFRPSLVIPPCQKSRYATYFDVAVLRCLLQPYWSEEGTQWSLMYYLYRLKHMLEEKPEKSPEPEEPPVPRPRSSSMVAAAPSLVNTHKTQVGIYPDKGL